MANKAYKEWRKQMLRTARERKAFVSGQFELTARCNLDCRMCYVHTLDHCAAKEKELTTQQWKQVFDDAHSAGLFFATLTGGECLLRPDFKELYLHLWNKRIMVTVLTNGTLLNSEYVEFFKQYKPEMIQISLYGISENGYLRVTGHKGFEKAVAAIRALKDAGIPVQIAVTPSVYCKEEYVQIIDFCKQNGFDYKPTEMNLITNRENPNKNDYQLTVGEMVELSVKRTALYVQPQPVENTPEPMGTETQPPVGMKCTGGSCVCNVSWEGKMAPCPTMQIGNFDVRELGFREAWERTKAAAAQVLLPAECVGCPYDKVCVTCPKLRSPKLDGHCDPQVCELTRRLVASGVKKL